MTSDPVLLFGIFTDPDSAVALAGPLEKGVQEAIRKDGARFSEKELRIVDAYKAMAARRAKALGVVSEVVTTTEPALSVVKMDEVSMSVSEVARRLGITRQAVIGRISRGTLPARKDDRGHFRVNIENLTQEG